MVKRLIGQLIAGTLALYLAQLLIGSVTFEGPFVLLVLAGSILGFINYFLAPLLGLITLPLRLLTFGVFGFILKVLFVWGVDILFPELTIPGILPLIYTTVIVWLFSALARRTT